MIEGRESGSSVIRVRSMPRAIDELVMAQQVGKVHHVGLVSIP